MATFHSSNTFTSYSSFFSSGLLAPHTPRGQRRGTFSSDVSEPWTDSDSCPPSPSQPSSPVPLPDDSVMDVDLRDFAISNMERRSATPTPEGQSTPMQQSPQKAASQAPQPHPRLRRRRSSLTQATSPMAAIRSPARAAGNALHLQKQIPRSRSRSGSLGGDGVGLYSAVGMAMATEETSLMGRMRSGSCSNIAPNSAAGSASASAMAPGLVFRPRRAVRRVLTTPVPGLRAPPPTAPLPALPPVSAPAPRLTTAQQLRPANINLGLTATAQSHAGNAKPVAQTSARARGMSVSSSTLSGDENRIDEEMKEN
ncbi:hypothetical protein BDZ97DRAFT_1759255 [Flammula alnicola]|nr:hypothetical protein BDZ97DRAFT_1759255 [Flammula alnicola]